MTNFLRSLRLLFARRYYVVDRNYGLIVKRLGNEIVVVGAFDTKESKYERLLRMLKE
jgi:hypothetical protein